jgi:hypothetical protein
VDSTTKQRYISTSIWSDAWFDSLSTLEKLIYLHLLTNEFTNAAGVYHFSLKQIRVDLDISRDEVQKAIEKFEAAGKAYYFQEYIIIPKWLKHQKISERNKIFLGVVSILKGLPDDIKRFIADRKHYDFSVEKYIEIPLEDGPCPVDDGLPPEKTWPIPEKGVAHTKNVENSAHDSDSDSDFDSNTYPDDDEFKKASRGKNSSSSSPSDPFPQKESVPRRTSPPEMLYGNAASVWETIRKAWNSHNCRFTADKLYLNLSYAQQERVRGSMATYTPDQMVKAIDRYFEERKAKPGGYEYKSFYLFVEKGLEFYVEV